MINIEVVCVRKNDSIDPVLKNFNSEIVFQAVSTEPVSTYAPGAAMGTPNTNPVVEPSVVSAEPEKIKYNLNGSFSVSVYDAQESASYVVGQTYKFSLDGKKK